MGSGVVLEVKNLSKQYRFFQLDNISFSVPKNQIVGLIGTNGSGKSTTVKSLLGLIRCNKSKLSYFGLDFEKNMKLIKNRIGVVLDEGYFYDSLTISEMKSIVSKGYKCWDEMIYKRLIDQFELLPSQKISTLSKGMKMKLSLAFAFSHHAELIIMDEPTSGLDPLVRSELISMLKNSAEKDETSILLSSHITSDLDKLADKVVMINKGRLCLDMCKKTLIDKYRIILKKEPTIEDIMLYFIDEAKS